MDEAIKVFQTNVDHHPDSWNAQDSSARRSPPRVTSRVSAAYIKAQALVKDPTQKKRIDATLAKRKAP